MLGVSTHHRVGLSEPVLTGRGGSAMSPTRPRSHTGRLGVRLTLLYVFCIYSGILDLTVYWLRIPLILGLTTGGLATIEGGLTVFTRERTGRSFALITGAMLIGIPFSVWPGGALNHFWEHWKNALVLFLILATFVRTFQDCHLTLATVAAARLFAGLAALAMGSAVEGRQVLGASRFSDPNDLALALLIAAPFWCYLTKHAASPLVRRVAPIALGLTALVLLRTGSRGGFLGVIAVCGYLFLAFSPRNRIRLLTAGSAVVLVAVAVLPERMLARYSTLFTDTQIAEESREGREYLLRQSLRVTAQNPLVGVGVGMFPIAEDATARDAGLRRGSWHVTHNMYTQVSSEVGIPAALCYCVIVFGTFFRLRRASRDASLPQKQRDAAFWFNASVVGFSASGFFLSVAYEYHLPLLAGVSLAMTRPTDSLAEAPPPLGSAGKPVPSGMRDRLLLRVSSVEVTERRPHGRTPP